MSNRHLTNEQELLLLLVWLDDILLYGNHSDNSKIKYEYFCRLISLVAKANRFQTFHSVSESKRIASAMLKIGKIGFPGEETQATGIGASKQGGFCVRIYDIEALQSVKPKRPSLLDTLRKLFTKS